MNKFIKYIVEAFDFNSVNKQNKTINPYNILLPKICRIIETPYNKLTADDKSFIRSIKDNMPIYKVNNKKELKSIISHAIKLFGYNCDLNWIDVSSITDMEGLFKGHEWNSKNKHKFNGDISKWDVSNVTNMKYMFYNSSFTNNISNWNVSNVTNMYRMFEYSVFNGDIS